MTQTPASARHAASADKCKALLQHQLPTKSSISVPTVYQGITGFIDCRAALARWLLEPMPVAAAEARRVPEARVIGNDNDVQFLHGHWYFYLSNVQKNLIPRATAYVSTPEGKD